MSDDAVAGPEPHSGSVIVDADPATIYALVSDVTRTGEWSPICTACWWDEGDGPSVGSWFTGRNQTAERTWETRSQVVVAESGEEFAWQVGGSFVRWGYTMRPREAGGTELVEHWEFLPEGLAMFREKFGDAAEHEIEVRTLAAHESIPATLAAIKALAEAEAQPTG